VIIAELLILTLLNLNFNFSKRVDWFLAHNYFYLNPNLVIR